jgi:hypothetical protein
MIPPVRVGFGSVLRRAAVCATTTIVGPVSFQMGYCWVTDDLRICGGVRAWRVRGGDGGNIREAEIPADSKGWLPAAGGFVFG